jgi:hypothetical protein
MVTTMVLGQAMGEFFMPRDVAHRPFTSTSPPLLEDAFSTLGRRMRETHARSKARRSSSVLTVSQKFESRLRIIASALTPPSPCPLCNH